MFASKYFFSASINFHILYFTLFSFYQPANPQAELFFSRLVPHDAEMAAVVALVKDKRPHSRQRDATIAMLARAALRTRMQSAHVLAQEARLLLKDV